MRDKYTTELRRAGWSHRAQIPNQAGFLLEVLLTDGRIIDEHVVYDIRNDMHQLSETPITAVVAWRKKDSK